MKPRFIVADTEVAESLGSPVIIILSDLAYWNTHYEELQSWCQLNGAEPQGMTVNIPNKSVLTAWCLKWL